MLRSRILSAIVMAIVVIAALVMLDPLGWALGMLAVLVVAAWEWGGFARLTGTARAAWALLLGALCVAAAAWTGLLTGAPIEQRSAMLYTVAAAFWLLGATLWLARNPAHPAASIVIASGIVTLVPAYLAVLELRLRGIVPFLLVGGIVWTADVAAYFTGRAIGRRKLAPSISPGKTWEGAIGAIVAVGIYALICAGLYASAAAVPPLLWLIVPAALLLGVASVVGDLFESALKRQAGLKDSGRILPGHGGVLDRIDALVPVLPLAMLGTLWLGQAS